MEKFRARVKGARKDASDIKTIFLEKPDNFVYASGQYVTVFMPGGSHPEGKAYSLSSATFEDLLSITVKKVGEYSGYLHELEIGDFVEISNGYGFFNPETDDQLIGIVTGCGVAPVWSVIKQTLKEDPSRKIDLFFGNKDCQGIPFLEEISEHEQKFENFTAHHYITRAKNLPKSMYEGRINFADCIKADDGEATHLTCGSEDFVGDVWQALSAYSVDESKIVSETFY